MQEHRESAQRKAPKTTELIKYFAGLKTDADTVHPTCHAQQERSRISGRRRWAEVENDYREEMKKMNMEHASHPLFIKVRKDVFPELRLQKDTKMLPECGICTRLSTLGRDREVPAQVAAAARKLRKLHREAVQANNKALCELDALCTRPLSTWVSFRADGSDWKRPFPVTVANIRRPSLEASLICSRLKFRDYDRKAIYVYFPDVWKAAKATGCDYWITCMMLELVRLFEANPDVRPEVLALHTDNTVRAVADLCIRLLILAQVATNKNRFVFVFLAYLLVAGWFKQIFFHFPVEEHGCMDLDAHAAALKKIAATKQISSVPALKKLLACSPSGISVCELTSVIDVHAMTEPVAVYPSGIDSFHFLHLYRMQTTVRLRGRLFLAKLLDEPTEALRFCGVEGGAAYAVLQGAQLEQVPDIIWHQPVVDDATRAVIAATLGSPLLCRAAADRMWWQGFASRYSSRTPPSVCWRQPCGSFASDVPCEAEIRAVMQELNASLRDVQKISPQQVAGFYTSLRARQELQDMAPAEIARRGLEWLTDSAELTEGADVDRINAAEAAEQKRAKRRRRVIVSVRVWLSLRVISHLSLQSDEEGDDDPRDLAYAGPC